MQEDCQIVTEGKWVFDQKIYVKDVNINWKVVSLYKKYIMWILTFYQSHDYSFVIYG